MNVVLKYNMEHINTLYEQENFEIIMDTCISTIVGSKERVDKNLGYLGHIGQILGFINSLNAALLDQSKVPAILNLLRSYNELLPMTKSLAFLQCSSLYILAATIENCDLNGSSRHATIHSFLQGLHRLILHTSASSCTNFISQFGETMDRSFFLKRQSRQHKIMLSDRDPMHSR